jgi:hypothetical protein
MVVLGGGGVLYEPGTPAVNKHDLSRRASVVEKVWRSWLAQSRRHSLNATSPLRHRVSCLRKDLIRCLYRVTSLIRNNPPPKDRHRTLSSPTVGSYKGGVFHERSTPVAPKGPHSYEETPVCQRFHADSTC